MANNNQRFQGCCPLTPIPKPPKQRCICPPGPRGPRGPQGPQGEQGPPGPPFLLNPAVPCDCSSTFTINQEVTLNFFLEGDVTGNLSLNGSICPMCNNAGSNLTLVFVDPDPSNGIQSFSFIPTSVQTPICGEIEGDFIQATSITGVYIPSNGTPTVAIMRFSLRESPTPGQDDSFSFSITELVPDTDFIVSSGTTLTPDTSIVVTDCP